MTNIKDKPGGRPAKKRIEKQQRVVSTKLTELQYYANFSLSISRSSGPGCAKETFASKSEGFKGTD